MSANPLVAPHLERFTEPYFDFRPDLIIESTNACNRACSGCYAANILVNKNRLSPSAKFLNADVLSVIMQNVIADTVAIRGGEPSIHPNINGILNIVAEKSKVVVLETHGRWIVTGAPLLNACRDLGVYIKVSFDSMHGLSEDQLYKIHDTLKRNSVNYLVAITEFSFDQFLETRRRCSWVPDGQIIFQQKAKKIGELIRPSLGVITADGKFANSLSVKSKFRNGSDHA